LNNFLKFIILKFKNEVENGIFMNGKLIKCFLFGIMGDNKEIYQLLMLKTNFGNDRFICRVCDIDLKNLQNNSPETCEITDNENYKFSIKMVKSNENNSEFYNCKNEE